MLAQMLVHGQCDVNFIHVSFDCTQHQTSSHLSPTYVLQRLDDQSAPIQCHVVLWSFSISKLVFHLQSNRHRSYRVWLPISMRFRDVCSTAASSQSLAVSNHLGSSTHVFATLASIDADQLLVQSRDTTDATGTASANHTLDLCALHCSG